MVTMKTNVFALWIYIISIISSIQARSSYCVREITRDPGFKECVGNYSMYREWVFSPSISMETNVTVTLICSSETRWFIRCLMSFIRHCPALIRDSVISKFHEISHLKKLDQFCHSSLGSCYAVQQCLGTIQYPSPSAFIPTPTPFSLMQDGVKTLCGPLKKTIECFNGTGDHCRRYLNDNSKMLNNTQPTFLTIATSHPAYDVTKRFVTNDCPYLPADFSTNVCVKSSVSSDGFVKCYQEVIAAYPPHPGEQNCDAYSAGHMCVAKFVGDKCGHEYTDAFVVVSPLFLSDVPVCQSVKPWPVSGDITGNRQPEVTVTGVPGILPATEIYPSSSCAKIERTLVQYALCIYFVQHTLLFL